MIDITAAGKAKDSLMEAAANLKTMAKKIKEISEDCGDDALAVNVSWASKAFYSIVDGIKSIFTRKKESSIPDGSITREIDDVADELEEYASVLEGYADSAYKLFAAEYGKQDAAYEEYLAELARQKAAEEMEQGGNN